MPGPTITPVTAPRERPILFSGPMVQALLSGRKTQTRRIIKPPKIWTDHFPVCDPKAMVADYQVWFWDGAHNGVGASFDCPYGVPGDRLWVKETWRPRASVQDWDLDVTYAADGTTRTIKDGEFGDNDWTMPKAAATGNVSPLFMPRWASRLTLEVTQIRAERLQDISEADAWAEGLYRSTPDQADRDWYAESCADRNEEPDWTSFDRGVCMVPGVPQGWGLNRDDRRRDQWAPTAQFGYRLLWNHINGPDSWDANPWVWAVSFNVLQPHDPEAGE